MEDQPADTLPRRTNTLAVVSLVAGIAGWVVFHPLLAPLVAVVTGHLARGQIRNTGEGGKGLATTGLVLGYAHLLLEFGVVLLILLFGIGALAVIVHGATHMPVPTPAGTPTPAPGP